jgi:protein tyrosine phosphatase
VWQQDVRVILMLTAESEGGQLKAHSYWKQKRYGPIHLNFLSEHRASLEPATIKRHRHRRMTNASAKSQTSEKDSGEQKSGDAYVTVRRFTLSHDGEPFARMREITHLQYSNWPDFGAPAEPAHVLGLVEQTDAVVRAAQTSAKDESRPVLVHCSAGCGRTGTFCTVDTVLDVMKSNPMPDVDVVEKVVRELRLQRLSMVQSLRQYVLCYETVLEWVVQQIQSPNLFE